MKKNEIYRLNGDENYNRELELLDEAAISQKNKSILAKWFIYLLSKGSVSKARVAKLSYQLRYILLFVKKDIDKLDLSDVLSIVAHFNTKTSISDATKADYRRVIKQFFKWWKTEDNLLYTGNKATRFRLQKFYDYIEKELSTTYKVDRINPNNIISDSDINFVIEKGANSIKEKALLKFLHETGVRAGELLGMTVSDVKISKNLSKVTVSGKTGLREIPIVTSVPFLTQWLSIHPFRDCDGFLWIGSSPRNLNAPLMHVGAAKLVKRCFEKAKLKKKCNLHWFRHSRASILAPKLTEIMLCQFMGWVLGSDQVKAYVHLNRQQLENIYLGYHGLESEKKKEKLTVKCGCGAINNTNARYCYTCGRPLSIDIALQDEETLKKETNKTIQFLIELMKDPEMLKKFEEFKGKS